MYILFLPVRDVVQEPYHIQIPAGTRYAQEPCIQMLPLKNDLYWADHIPWCLVHQRTIRPETHGSRNEDLHDLSDLYPMCVYINSTSNA